MENIKSHLKAKIFQYPKEKEKYALETRMFINIQFGIVVLFLLTLTVESYFKHYPDAKIIWILCTILPVISIEMILRERFAKLVYFMSIFFYTCLVFLGIHFSGSILTPSVLFSFLGILILSVIAKGALKYISVAAIIISVIYHAIIELNVGDVEYVYREIYIDWVIYFTIIALVVVWIISRIIHILSKYDETISQVLISG